MKYKSQYDDQLNNIDIYKLHPTFMPHIGTEYDEYRVLHIGESHYINQTPDTEKYDIKYFEKWWSESCDEVAEDSPEWFDTRCVVAEKYMRDVHSAAYTIFTNFVKSFSKVVLHEEINKITSEDKKLYRYIAFMNFFQMPSLYSKEKFWKSLEVSAKKSGDKTLASKMWDDAVENAVTTVDTVVEIINPKAIVFTSISAGKAYREYGGRYAKDSRTIFTSHPATSYWYRGLSSLGGKTGKEVLENELERIYS